MKFRIPFIRLLLAVFLVATVSFILLLNHADGCACLPERVEIKHKIKHAEIIRVELAFGGMNKEINLLPDQMADIKTWLMSLEKGRRDKAELAKSLPTKADRGLVIHLDSGENVHLYLFDKDIKIQDSEITFWAVHPELSTFISTIPF